ncbi:SMP-30/gluconolactonase/LRE family protein [Jidongwangia harbinensis]|uniref:SMP-30/gluconolactonase/LRE family protein n=1 Tax=Jidongwangia harbinensis TaxID=2878561 RepID=UPI001CD9DA80|nr:SMP-30/gluconolactonase/LRE family protein [Jidongwangia harbinensis]MCA2219554.1 SMP-30/gluconolactonase/LRE family protein [Jidongwangia harbinensis]
MIIDAVSSPGRLVGTLAGATCLLLGIASAALATHTALDTPPGAPPGVCETGTDPGPPLPGTALSASRIQGGFQFLEGPVWVADPGYLVVSDLRAATGAEQVQPSTIHRLAPPAAPETFIAASGSNGLALSPDGQQIIAATHDNRALSAYRLSDRSRTVLAADHQGRAFNSPNDVTVRADGVVYFTDPSFQRGRRPDAMGGRTGVFRVANGQVTLVDDTVRQPNGIALSPDGSTLYVGAFNENRIYAYPVQPDGSTGQRTVFATIASPDGVTVDCAGNVYWVSHNEGRVHVFAPTGATLGTISTGRQATNAAFGGADRRTLFITAGQTGDYGIHSIQLGIPGYPY